MLCFCSTFKIIRVTWLITTENWILWVRKDIWILTYTQPLFSQHILIKKTLSLLHCIGFCCDMLHNKQTAFPSFCGFQQQTYTLAPGLVGQPLHQSALGWVQSYLAYFRILGEGAVGSRSMFSLWWREGAGTHTTTAHLCSDVVVSHLHTFPWPHRSHGKHIRGAWRPLL